MEFVKCLGHPEEFYNLLRFRMGGRRNFIPKMDQDSLSSSLKTCYKYLNQTSRSFAAVIQALDGDIRHAICVFYLVLRALDTVEDDMSISVEKKIPLLCNFHTFLYDPEWRFTESKEKDRQVLEDFPTISLEFRNLAEKYQAVTLMMDATNMPAVKAIIYQYIECANSMGLFLQKTNIIRDYLEDQQEGRKFWPQEVWGRYIKKLEDFAKPENVDVAVQCLNELITNTLQHIPDVLTYLSRLRNQSVFNFCAIPQVMAIATLAACYNNQQVFKGVVKIRKGQAVTLMKDALPSAAWCWLGLGSSASCSHWQRADCCTCEATCDGHKSLVNLARMLIGFI